MTKTRFDELGLAAPFLQAVQELGYETATPIQAAAIPVVLAGRDLIGCAQTGTGKTAAFTLPMLDRLMQTRPARSTEKKPADSRRRGGKGSRPKPRDIRALVLSPTRELTAQIHESLGKYGKHSPLRQTVVFGGVSQHHQVKALRHGVDALVATPGRLLDLMDQGYIDLKKVQILVFDEADQMLDMGFLPALNRIVASVPKQRQTLMFSATMPKEIRQLAQQWLTNPESVEVTPVSTPADRIAQSVHLVDKKKKPDLLSHFLQQTPRGRTLVFSRTKHGADKIVKRLKKDGLHAAAIHGNKSQGARNRALAQFKSKNPPVLVATDIAARGLDIDSVSHVVNFDLPEVPETYVHRIGRTARAGAEGVAVSFCAGDERGLLRQIERLMKVTLDIEPTLAGFEPTDRVTNPAPRRGGGGSRGGQGRSSQGRSDQNRTGQSRRGGSSGKANYGKSGNRSSEGNRSAGAGGRSGGGKPSGKPGSKPKRYKAKSEQSRGDRQEQGKHSEATGEEKPRRQKGSTNIPAGRKKTAKKKTSATGQAVTVAAARKRRQRRTNKL